LSKFVLFIALTTFLSTAAFAGPATVTAQRCGVNQSNRPQHILATPDGNAWRTYGTVSEIPDLSTDGGESANYWTGQDGNVLVSTFELGEDFYIYTDYCFDRSGRLIQLRFEIRTAWGWGFREEGPVAGDTLKPATSGFFNTSSDEPTAKPDGANDIPEAMKPKLCLRISSLPFAKLLGK
jgi:hypothetical protein